jgi:ribosomal protein S18 acetylase RimI-like enzyme
LKVSVEIKNAANTILRFLNGLKRPSKKRNLKLLTIRGETHGSFVIREASMSDVPALAALHVKTWNETYCGNVPTREMREFQWRELFKEHNRNWFVLLVESKPGQPAGFAMGKPYNHGDLPQFKGELNKIYLLRDYQRIGLGRMLMRSVARRFLQQGISNMVLFGIPQNP